VKNCQFSIFKLTSLIVCSKCKAGSFPVIDISLSFAANAFKMTLDFLNLSTGDISADSKFPQLAMMSAQVNIKECWGGPVAPAVIQPNCAYFAIANSIYYCVRCKDFTRGTALQLTGANPLIYFDSCVPMDNDTTTKCDSTSVIDGAPTSLFFVATCRTCVTLNWVPIVNVVQVSAE